MRAFAASNALLLVITSLAFGDVTQVWSNLAGKRKALASYHQAFDRTSSFTLRDHDQKGKRSTVLDGSGARWREQTLSGAGDWIYLFDGTRLFHLEGAEYTSKDFPRDKDMPEPEPYDQSAVDLKRGVEVKRFPCGLSGVDHECLALDLPVKPKRGTTPDSPSVTAGVRQIIIDSTTGLALFSRTVQDLERRGQSYRSEIEIKSSRMSWNETIDPATFRVPSGYSEVKELSKWDAKKMKRELAGKPAPDFALMDMSGQVIKLSELRGKTVLLDFWATWCGPCLADAPSLDKLAKKYNGKNFQIISVSVDEDRATVQKYLVEHPHAYPVALTTENEMPRTYQIGIFPTYVIIDSDGNIAEATEGDSGFSKLKKLLMRAGLDTE